MNTPLTTAEIVERLRPSAKVDEEVDGAIRALRANGLVMLAGSLNEWLVDNNARKSEVASALLALEGERDEAREQWHTNSVALIDMQQNRDTLQRHFNECTVRAEAAEAELAKVRTATVETLSMCERYADFIRTSVKADDIEMHPYLPELEQVIERARAALSEKTV